MPQYGFTSIQTNEYSPHVWTSVQEDLQIVFQALQTMFPSAKINTGSLEPDWLKDPGLFTLSFERLSNRGDKLPKTFYPISNWLVSKFCDMGWEPYSATVSASGYATHYLRKKLE